MRCVNRSLSLENSRLALSWRVGLAGGTEDARHTAGSPAARSLFSFKIL